MSSALERGRTLHPDAVKVARRLREGRLVILKKRARETGMLSLTRRERRELANLAGTYPAYKVLGVEGGKE
ncbi:MAG: hypothetical protein Q8P12_04120 [bacterium]|nr:hypothetical protein [bacterium]